MLIEILGILSIPACCLTWYVDAFTCKCCKNEDGVYKFPIFVDIYFSDEQSVPLLSNDDNQIQLSITDDNKNSLYYSNETDNKTDNKTTCNNINSPDELITETRQLLEYASYLPPLCQTSLTYTPSQSLLVNNIVQCHGDILGGEPKT